MTDPLLLFRVLDNDGREEMAVSSKHFRTTTLRVKVPQGALVIPRYSMLPYPHELAAEMAALDATLINEVDQHLFAADIRRWAPVLGTLTPQTWTAWHSLPEGKSFVVKGTTNSRKTFWSSKMFASDRSDVVRVIRALYDDQFIGEQGLVVREYVPLRKLGEGINGLPISHEWRFFFLDRFLVDSGYYWSSHPETLWDLLVDEKDILVEQRDPIQWSAQIAKDRGMPVFLPKNNPSYGTTRQQALERLAERMFEANLTAPPPAGALAIAQRAASLVSPCIRFFAVDVAETPTGEWLVIEINDGCQAGLCSIPPDRFYANLKLMLGGGGTP